MLDRPSTFSSTGTSCSPSAQGHKALEAIVKALMLRVCSSHIIEDPIGLKLGTVVVISSWTTLMDGQSTQLTDSPGQ